MNPKGISNLGSTCYLGAALQALLHTPPLTAYFLAGCAEGDMHTKRQNACAVATEYAALVTRYWKSETPGPLDLGGLHASLGKFHKAFGKLKEHDAHEAMSVVLRCLHEALCKLHYPLTASLALEQLHGPDRAAWDAYHCNNYSIISEIFEAQIRVRVRNAYSGHAYDSTTYEHCIGLSLPVSGMTLNRCLNDFFAPTVVEGFKDKDTVLAVRVTREAVYLPVVLMIQFKRLIGKAKHDTFIDYPAHLDLSHLTPGSSSTYQLFAVVSHNNAHYTAMCHARDAWTVFDDGNTRRVDDINNIITKDAYVLMYKKRL